MADLNSLVGLYMAEIGTANGELAISGETPKDHLNSQEVFRLVLFKRWGLEADYDQAEVNEEKKRSTNEDNPVLSDAHFHPRSPPRTYSGEPLKVHEQWADASNLMRLAIGDGLLEPLVTGGDPLHRVTRD